MPFNSAILSCMIVALASILLDLIMGVLVSIKAGTWSISKLPQFLATHVLPYLGGLIVLAVFANYVCELSYAFYVGTGLVALKFSKEALIDKLKVLFG